MFTLRSANAGAHVLSFRRIGYRTRDTSIVLLAGVDAHVDIALQAAPTMLGEVVVTTASRQPERVVDAPAAISVVAPERMTEMAGTGQTPLLVTDLPGVHAMQSGLYDFNLNARGFNATLSRNVLVLVDGRDMSVPLLGTQDWPDVTVGEGATRVEMVRGPGSALYGANALNGVLAITTAPVRESHGTQLSLTGGELHTGRVDATHSMLSRDDRWGYRVNGGYAESSTWDVSRTSRNYLAREYAGAGVDASTVQAPLPGYELVPLQGQTTGAPLGTPAEPRGSADAVQRYFGAVRAEYYPKDGSIFTVEGGSAHIANPVITTGAGRSQIMSANRPWARAAWTSDAASLLTYYTGRSGRSVSLGTGAEALDAESIVHAEAQFNRQFDAGKGRVVTGASARRLSVDSKGTVLAVANDGRADASYALFGQVDYQLARMLKAVAATRYDRSAFTTAQLSPKFGLVFTPRAGQSVRATVNRGFRSPSPFERFLNVAAGPPLDLSALEQGLRASSLGPSLAGVPAGTLFTQSGAVPLLAIGNAKLRPQQVTSWELGYKGEAGRLFLATDVYYGVINDFTSGILTNVNPDFLPWTAPSAVPAPSRLALEAAVRNAVGGLTRLPNGGTAYVLSYGNEGRATEWGAEFSASVAVNDRIHVNGNYSLNRYAIRQATFFSADTIVSNTPPNIVNLSGTYDGLDGLRVRLGIRHDDSFFFRDYLWAGAVPTSTSVDANVSRPFGEHMVLGVSGTNVLDERRFHLYGGSIVGRRVLATLTWRF